MDFGSLSTTLIMDSPYVAIIVVQSHIILKLLDRFFRQQDELFRIVKTTETAVDVAQETVAPESPEDTKR